MGFTLLSSYDADACATQCNTNEGCSAINIYFERDPTVDVGPHCLNVPSQTLVKCVFWGGEVSLDNALNFGQYRDNFEVVITGSNGYNAVADPTLPGYNPRTDYGEDIIDAPADPTAHLTFLGAEFFVNTPFDPALCAAACQATANCAFFNTYILYLNSIAQGQGCNVYSETWGPQYATNAGYPGAPGKQYTFGSSIGYSNSANPNYESTITGSQASTSSSSTSSSISSSSSPSSTSSSSSSSSSTLTSTSSSSSSSSTSSSSSSTSSTSTSTPISFTTITSTYGGLITLTSTESIIGPSATVIVEIPLPDVNGFAYLGCEGGGLLAPKWTLGLDVSLEYCSTFCTGYAYMSVQDGDTCSCGFSASGTQATPATGCTTPCTGNPEEICGGDGLNDLYFNPSPNNVNNYQFPQQLTLADQTVANGFTKQGCFDGGILTSKQSTSLTPFDVDACSIFGEGYAYFALENNAICSCGYEPTTSGIPGLVPAAGGCNSMCPGNSAEDCGGDHTKVLYQNLANVDKSPFPQQLAPVDQTVTNGFTKQGCFNGGLLTSKDNTRTSLDPFDASSCSVFCEGYTYFALENGNRCSCGFQPTTSGVAGLVPSSNCGFICSGNSADDCGGFGAKILYQNLANTNTSPLPQQLVPADQTVINGFQAQGCFDSNNQMSVRIPPSPSNSIEYCATQCAEYTWFAVENQDECYCGFEPVNTTPDTGCNDACPAASVEDCGGFSRSNLYKSTTGNIDGFLPVGCYSGFPSTNPVPAGSLEQCAALCQGTGYFAMMGGDSCSCGNTLPQAATPEPNACTIQCPQNSYETCGGDLAQSVYQAVTLPLVVGNFVSQGCYENGLIEGISTGDNYFTNTLESCSAFCSDYAYFAVENGVHCECGTAPGDLTHSATCNTPCSGNLEETCGGSGPTNLFKRINNNVVNGYVSQGCISGSVLDAPGTTGLFVDLEFCASFCAGYTYFSVQNGNHCECGDTLLDNTSPREGCTNQCVNNLSENCGGFGVAQLYMKPKVLNVSGFELAGCFTGAFQADSDTTSNTLSLESCATICSGSSGFSVAQGNTCSCGTVLGNNLDLKASCNTVCSGASNEVCGGLSASTLYVKPQSLPTINGYSLQNCLSNVQGTPYGGLNTDPSMSVEFCAGICIGNPYFAVQDGTGCTCFSALTATGQLAQCGIACVGDLHENCGDFGVSALYGTTARGPQ